MALTDSRLTPSSKVATVVSWAMTIVPVVVLFGWMFDIPAIRVLVPGMKSMNPMSALSFIGFGVCIRSLQNPKPSTKAVVFTISALIFIMAASRVGATLMGIDRALDTLLFSDKLDREVRPNRLSYPSAIAIAFAALSMAFMVIQKSSRWVAQGLSIVVTVIGVVVTNSFIFALIGGQEANAPVPALQTAIFNSLFALVIFSLSPREGLAFVLTQDSSSSKLAKRLMIALIFVPPVLAIIVRLGVVLGYYDRPHSGAYLIALLAGIFSIIVWYGAKQSYQSEERIRLANEEMLRAKEEADRANAAKSEFLSRMSHELRTPLNAVIGYSQLLELSSNDEDVLESAANIEKSGYHLLDLINEILDLARIEAGKMSLSLEPTLANVAINHALDLVRPIAKSNGIEIVAEHETWKGICVIADRQRMTQVLLNLLTNAVKYNRENGQIRIWAERVEGNICHIFVSDTGQGIRNDRLEKLFQPFERLGEQAVEGTGLGLALSQKIAKLMGGEILLVQSSEEGSIFALELSQCATPMLETEVVQKRKKLGSLPDGVLLKAVYIEDNVSNVALLERVFKQFGGIQLLPAALGRTGIELVREHKPDLVFLDLHLPDIPGDEVLRMLKQDEVTKGIPVIVLSADATEGKPKKLLSLGAAAYLTKPLELSELFDEVHKVCLKDPS